MRASRGMGCMSPEKMPKGKKKARRDDARGQRLKYRTTMNTNRMDKKANRLMNGVSVAHAKR